MKSIVASQGDTWDKISFEQYGSEYFVNELLLSNANYNDVLVFSGGEKLVIPDIVIESNETLPPWRK